MIEQIIKGIIIVTSVGAAASIAYLKLENKIARNQIKLLRQSESIADLQEKVETLETSNRYLRDRIHDLDGNTEERF